MGKQILPDRVISPELSSRTSDNTKKILIPLLLLVFLVDFFLNSSVQPRLRRNLSKMSQCLPASLRVCVQPNNEGNK